MTEDERRIHRELRERVAAEHKLALYRHYGEPDAAHHIGIDYSTLKRWRRKWRKLGIRGPFVEFEGGGVKYFGYQICDILILGKDVTKWHEVLSELISLETGGSPSAATPTTDTATSPESETSSVFRSAQKILKTRKTD